jgi:hypothetical protein
MKKYYIGILIIAAISLGLCGYAIANGVSGKQDKETAQKAQDVSTKLNAYVSDKGTIPASLDEVGVKDAPSTIRYTKKSDESYEFCVTYKQSGEDLGLGFTSILFGSFSRGITSSTDDYSSPNYLYLPYSHKKGENCQTITPYTYGSSNPYFDSPGLQTNTLNLGSTGNTTGVLNTERETDIKALHGQIEAYYAQNGKYPTLKDMNDPTWRATDMKGLDSEALKDPQGKTAELKAKPTSDAYSYDVTADDGTACDNLKKDCALYILTAMLSGGGTYTKSNLN